MTAIAGIVHFDGSDPDRRDLERMDAALRPFGAEGGRIVQGDGAGFVTRLKHFTPEDRFDRQPIERGGKLFAFQGRIDNRPELLADLGEGSGAERADSALAAAAWERWGRQAPPRLIGSFASARWDAGERRLSLATSAPTGRPLLVHRAGPQLYFATHAHALFALPQVPRALNTAALGDIMVKNTGNGETLFREVEIVPSASIVEHHPAGSETARYWAPDPARRSPIVREEEAWEELHAMFDTVVRAHLRAIEPVGIQMSGGLNSALLAGQATRILGESGKTLLSYTRVPAPGTPLRPVAAHYNDERPRVEAIARMHPNLRPTFVEAGSEPVMADLNGRFARGYGTAGAGLTFATGYDVLYRRAAADGVRVLLTGASGNVSLTYDGHARLGALLKRGRWLALYRELRGLARHSGSARYYAKSELFDAMVPQQWRAAFMKLRHRSAAPWDHYSPITAQFAEESGAKGRMRERNNIKLHWQALDSWGRRAALFSRTPIGGGVGGGAEGHGIETRDPFGDRRLVELCLSLPDHVFLKGGIERRAARLGFLDLVPESIARDFSRGRQDVDWAPRLERDRAEIERTLDLLEEDPQTAALIDVPRMRGLWAGFATKDWRRASLEDMIAIKQGFMSGIEIGRYVRWFEGKN